MLVFKFGGASVKDAQGVINLAQIVKKYQGEQLLIIVSAMGKTTNALERLTRAYVEQAHDMHDIFDEIKQQHYHIVHELFGASHPVFDEVANTFVEIDWMIEDEPHDDYDFIYDQIVSVGELVSSRIVAAYLKHAEVASKWLDVRGYIHTDNTYREGAVDWAKTNNSIQNDLPAILQNNVIVTQGFLGGTSENFTTTLGREGSDYTAAIFASALEAESVTIWKDVPGVLNADPKLFTNTVKFDELAYSEAIEMTYYGATVIHPKTIKPLQNKGIPLLVKPFNDAGASGTKVHQTNSRQTSQPVIIVKQKQVIFSVSSTDHSFISEVHLSEVFSVFAAYHIKVNVMQVSALSFTVCFDQHERFEQVQQQLASLFRVKYNDGLTLITVRPYTQDLLTELTAGKVVLLEQISRNTAQLVVK